MFGMWFEETDFVSTCAFLDYLVQHDLLLTNLLTCSNKMVVFQYQ